MSNSRIPIKFDVYRGEQFLRTETFSEPIIKIGKVASSHVRLDDELASRMHAMIEVTGPDEVYIIDLGSASGTYVNGQKTNKSRLQSGDQIQIGQTRLVVEVEDAGFEDNEATMAVSRENVGVDFAAMAAEHADPSAPPAGYGAPAPSPGYSTRPSAPDFGRPPPGEPVQRPAPMKGTLHGFQAPSLPPAGPAQGPGGGFGAGFQPPPQRTSAPPAPQSVLPVMGTSNPFGNQYGGTGSMVAAPLGGPATETMSTGGPVAYGGEYDEPAADYIGGHDGHYEDPESVRYGLIAAGPAPSPDEVETGDRALEVVVMWGDNSVLHVDHLNPVRSYYVGESTDSKGKQETDFLIGAELLGTQKMPIVVDAGGTGAVVIPQGATGEIIVGNDQMSMHDLIASGRAQPSSELAGAYQYPLPPGATARVNFRGLTFVVRPVNAGKPVGIGQGGGINLKQQLWTLLSFAIHILFLLMMYFMPPGGSALSLDLLSEDARLAKYLMEPPEVLEEETPDWLESSDADEEEGGKGKRHKDEEGQMGKEESKKTKNKYGIQGPADNQDPHMAREAAKEEAKTAGILGVLAQSTGAWNSPTSPYGQDTALGYDPMSALGALMGDQIGENFGFGGLGLRGTGRGGGGTGEGTIGLGNVGTIGHGAGGGSGSGYGRGAGGFRGRNAKVPQIRSGNADVRGSLSKEVIRRVIQRHINEVRFCYEQELNSRPDLSGRVQVKFIISPSGAVQAANVESSSLGAARAEQCIAKAVRRWTFPAPDGGGIVIVSYPFVLENAGS